VEPESPDPPAEVVSAADPVVTEEAVPDGADPAAAPSGEPDDEFVESDGELALESEGSASATPYPLATAVPIPSATASAPTRPM
jgi:hypothetical protein